jgi:type II secretion system protein G
MSVGVPWSKLERSKPMKKGGDSAFTLIELLIVVAIIAILALIAVPNFLEAQTRAKISRAKADMRSLNTALEAYRVDYNQYPPDVDSGAYPRMHDDWGNELASYHMITTPVAYMTTIPRDPFYMSQGGTPTGIANKTIAYFEYSEENLEDQRNPSKAREIQSSGCGFVIISMGPDRQGDFGWSGAEWRSVGDNVPWPGPYGGGTNRCNMYDPTNGTVSIGDIIRSRKGYYGGGGS